MSHEEDPSNTKITVYLDRPTEGGWVACYEDANGGVGIVFGDGEKITHRVPESQCEAFCVEVAFRYHPTGPDVKAVRAVIGMLKDFKRSLRRRDGAGKN